MNYYTADEMRRMSPTRQKHWYNPETGYLHEIEKTTDRDGELIYIVAPHPCHYLCNGYPVICWGRRSMQLSHAVWAWHNGTESVPKRVRHLNGDKLDTRIENLARHCGRIYRAQIWAGGKNHYLGMYRTEEEARAAEDQLRTVLGLEKREVSPKKQQQAAKIDLWSDSAESIIERNSRYFD